MIIKTPFLKKRMGFLFAVRLMLLNNQEARLDLVPFKKLSFWVIMGCEMPVLHEYTDKDGYYVLTSILYT